MKQYKRPLNRSITIGCIAFIIVLCILLSIANLSMFRHYVYKDCRSYISYILDCSMSHIDGDDLKKCIETGEESDTYKETLLFMDDLINSFGDIHYLYAVLPLNTEDTGSVMSVLSAERYHDRYVDTEGNLYLGWISDDEYDSETAAKLFEIMDGDEIVYFEEKTEWGTDYTGAMPIKDSQGNSVAVLAADIDISFIDKVILEYAMINICIIAILGMIFIGFFLYWSRKNITRPIRSLEESAVGFAEHSHGQRDVESLVFDAPKLKKDNEIKALSDAVVKMTKDMRNYVADIISAEKKAASMQELANRDPLTGIRNKTAYDNESQLLVEEIKTGSTKIGLAIVDLNFLKKINDTYGHDIGDSAIRKLCQMVCEIFSHSAVYRIGGDEFAIILKGNDYDQYDRLVERFHADCAELAEDSTVEPWEKITASIGAAFYDASVDDGMGSLFRRADQDMYEHKKAMNALRED